MTFVLHPQLAKDSHRVAVLPLCEVRLQNNCLFPWLVLVPQRENVSEIIDLPETEQQQLMREIAATSHILKALYKPDKLNVAALGNVVPQLHVHVVARFRNDAAWDRPVWGQGSEVYAPDALQKTIAMLQHAFRSAA